MTAFIRSLCLAALLATGSAWAQQQQADNPDNPHSTKAKDKQGSSTSSTDTNQQVQQGETANPQSPQYKDQVGTSADRTGKMADTDRDHDMAMKNATPEMQLQKLHKANQHEIEMGKLAEQNGTDRVKSFARTIVRDHQDADQKVMDFAKKKNISLSDTAPMSADKQREKEMKKDRLGSLKGTDFDREFANEMAKGHQKVISLVQAWTQDCKDQDLCSLEKSLLPTLQKHEQMAERLRMPAAQGRAPEPNR